MSAAEIINELLRLTKAERRLVLDRLREVAAQEESAALHEQTTAYDAVDLRARGIGEAQAGNLRARLQTFAEDWDRPEASIYDEDPAR